MRGYLRADAGRSPGSSTALPYEYFFEDAPDDVKAMSGFVSCEQEDRDFADALQRAGRRALRIQTAATR